MAFSATITSSVAGFSNSYSDSFSVTGGKRVSLDESIPDSSTNLEVAFTLDVSQAKCFLLSSNKALTVKTNDGSSPANTFTLEANVPFIWPKVSGATFADTASGAVSTDITKLLVTNASGAAATLKLDCLVDPTA